MAAKEATDAQAFRPTRRWFHAWQANQRTRVEKSNVENAFAKGFHANMVCQVKIYCVEYFYLRFHHPLLGIGIWISQIWYGTAKCHEV